MPTGDKRRDRFRVSAPCEPDCGRYTPCVRFARRKANPREIALKPQCELPESAQFSIEKSEQFSVEIDIVNTHC